METDTATSQSGNLVLMNADVLDEPVVSPEHRPEQRVDELGRLLLEFKLTAEKESERNSKTLKKLKRQVFWLKSGLVIALLGLSGSLVGSSYVLKAQQTELADTVSEIAAQDGPNGEFVARLDALEKQAQQLDDKVAKELPALLAPTTSQLEDLSQTVATLEENLDQRKSVASVLATALQDLVDTPTVDTVSASTGNGEAVNETEDDTAPADEDATGEAPSDSGTSE